MKIDIEGIKDAVYEFEGLLELAELREDKLQALLPLMKNKLDIINSLFNDSVEDDDLQEDAEEEEMDDQEIGETAETEETEKIAESDDKEIIEEPQTETEHYGSDFSASRDVVVKNDDDEDVVVKNDDDEDVVIKNDDDEEESDYEPVFIALESDEDEESETAQDLHNKKMTDPNAPKPAFCINDRFRFRRELFNNSDSAFNAAMDLVATMDDYEEAEDYFIGDLGWDLEKPEVMDFMAIIRNYFEK
ncbi:MAG: hypothetical protein K2M39_08740 [Muribaculaceae bacterium]|nr:hypothetical protein [Muribaculaceae bacterium]